MSEQSKTDKITKTKAQWRDQLTPEQYAVTREKDTERPFTGEYNTIPASGNYTCICCGYELFDVASQFTAGCGWPSFFQPLSPTSVTEHADTSHGMRRTEVVCPQCDAHLGHVFNDGPQPTGLRYCINSVSIQYQRHLSNQDDLS